jgi:fructokinase
MPQQNDSPIVVGMGELLWDCFSSSRRPGGAPANVAFHANQLGCRGTVLSRVGRDADGDELVAFLSAQGLQTQFIQRDETAPTGRVTVDTSVPGRPEYVIHENTAWDAIAFDPPTATLMKTAAAVCFGTLAQRSGTTRETIRRCLRAVPALDGPAATHPSGVAAGCLKVYDVNLRQNWYQREWIDRSLGLADVVKLNHDEVQTIAAMFDLTEDRGEPFANALQERFGATLVCITRAEHGCLLVGRGETVDVPGADVAVVDAVGAGDAFTAALIFALLNGWPLPSAGRFANAVGGLVTTRPGAMPPLAAEFEQLKREFGSVVR